MQVKETGNCTPVATMNYCFGMRDNIALHRTTIRGARMPLNITTAYTNNTAKQVRLLKGLFENRLINGIQ
jgi:hypothetical protein